jgi:predicted CoA-binding protein
VCAAHAAAVSTLQTGTGGTRAANGVSPRRPVPPDRAHVAAILRSARRIAVVGLSPKPERPSHGVASYLQRAGYTIIPVRPTGRSILGEPVQPDLKTAATAAGPIDIVDIFRRSEFVPALLDALLAVHPRLVWMQVGIRDDETAARLEAAGIPVVMDRCLAVDHHSLGG